MATAEKKEKMDGITPIRVLALRTLNANLTYSPN